MNPENVLLEILCHIMALENRLLFKENFDESYLEEIKIIRENFINQFNEEGKINE